MVRRLASHVSAFVVGRLEVAMINHYKVEGVVSTKQSAKTDFDLLAPSAAPGVFKATIPVQVVSE